MRKDVVPNDPFREAAERAVREWATWDSLAEEIGWMRPHRPQGDGTRLKRAVGAAPIQGHYQKCLSYEKAEKIMRVLHLDPVDVGL